MTDYTERNRRERGARERIAFHVPLFQGYEDKEIRKESDRKLRTFMYQRLEVAKENLKSVRRYAHDNGLTRLYSDCDLLIATIDTVSQKVCHAEHAYNGFYDRPEIREDGLDRIYSFDSWLVKRTLKIEEMSRLLTDRLAAESLETSDRSKTGSNHDMEPQIGELLRETNLYNIELSQRREMLSKI